VDETQYRALYLTAEDLEDLAPKESVHTAEPDPGDAAYPRLGGIRSGFQGWERWEDGDLVRRLVDIRWVFPKEEAARAYHGERAKENSEGFRPLPPPTAILGEGSLMFQGNDPFGLGLEMHIHLFTVGPVAAKVFTSGLPEGERLKACFLAARRLQQAFGR